MRTPFKILISVFFLILAVAQARAQSPSQEQDLTDYMTPYDLAQEMSAQNPMGEMMFWQSSEAQPRLIIIVNKAEQGTAEGAQTIEAYVDGQLAYKAQVSTAKERIVHAPPSANYPDGRTYTAHTPTGTFRITHRDINHVSNTWQGASMPFAQFFIGGIALHATVPEHFAMIGKRDSGGCVRMLPRDAKAIWNLVSEIGVKETEVIVYDGSESPHPLATPINNV